jgi:hypothetical protein
VKATPRAVEGLKEGGREGRRVGSEKGLLRLVEHTGVWDHTLKGKEKRRGTLQPRFLHRLNRREGGEEGGKEGGRKVCWLKIRRGGFASIFSFLSLPLTLPPSLPLSLPPLFRL